MYDALRLLFEDVATELGVPARDVLGASRAEPVTRSRNLSCAIAADVLQASHREIGRVIKRDHSTISNAAQKGRALLGSDIEARRVYEKMIDVQRERVRLALIGELAVMNRTIARYRRRAAVIGEMLGLEKAPELESEAAE